MSYSKKFDKGGTLKTLIIACVAMEQFYFFTKTPSRRNSPSCSVRSWGCMLFCQCDAAALGNTVAQQVFINPKTIGRTVILSQRVFFSCSYFEKMLKVKSSSLSSPLHMNVTDASVNHEQYFVQVLNCVFFSC